MVDCVTKAPAGDASLARRRLFVHIGLAKTGSSSIQGFLHAQSCKLEQLGYHVLVAGAERGSHGRLVMGGPDEPPKPEDHIDVEWQAVLDEVTRCRAPRFVLSAEQFTHASRARFAAAAQVSTLATSAGLDVKIIGCVRPQWQWIESNWAETVWSGLHTSKPFDECVGRLLADRSHDFDRVFRPWRELFGHVHILPLDRAWLPDGLIVAFLRTLEIGDGEIIEAARVRPRSNTRRGAKELDVRRLVGVWLASRGLTAPQRVRAMRHLDGLGATLCDDRPFAPFSQGQIPQLNRHFANANERFALDYGVDPDGVLFPNPNDGLERPHDACWADLEAGERGAVEAFLHARIGVDVSDGLLVGSDHVARPRTVYDATAMLAPSPPVSRARAKLVRLAKEVGRLLQVSLREARGQTRTRFRPIARWLYWQFTGLFRREGLMPPQTRRMH